MLGFFAILSLIYVVRGVHCAYRVVREWRSLWDDDVTAQDMKLARSAGFYLLVPPSVALHELGHAALVWAQGLKVVDWTFLGYMGTVSHLSAGPLGDFAIAAAGNVVTLAIGVGALAVGIERPGHPTRNILLIELGRQSCFLVLFFYPLLCLTFPGDFATIYDFHETPIASSVAAAVHASVLALGYGFLWRQRWRPRALLLDSPLASQLLQLERRVALDPADTSARRALGILYQRAGDRRRARSHLEKVIEAGRVDAHVRLAFGTLLVEAGEPVRGIEELRRALEGLLRPEDRLLAEVPLIRALIDTGAKAEAGARAEALARAHPDSVEIRELLDRLR